jgi:hypothetical protein
MVTFIHIYSIWLKWLKYNIESKDLPLIAGSAESDQPFVALHV